MNQRFILFRRAGVFYCEDRTTKKQTSLRTRNEDEALTLLHAKNESARQPVLNLQIARTYLAAGDPALSAHTWQHVMDQIISTKHGSTRERWEYASQDDAFDSIRHRKIIETTAEQFLAVLKHGSVSTNVYLRRAHNYALGMNWLPWPILPKLHWPAVQYKEKRAITLEEHQKIIGRERNAATRAFYQLLWHLGGSQSDIATLRAEDIDWQQRTVAYRRAKTGVTALISFGDDAAEVLGQLPRSGLLFPALARIHERHRSKLFIKRLATVGITGVSLHSYRYAWAERAKASGYPERFAMQALSQSSKAVHRAYPRAPLGGRPRGGRPQGPFPSSNGSPLHPNARRSRCNVRNGTLISPASNFCTVRSSSPTRSARAACVNSAWTRRRRTFPPNRLNWASSSFDSATPLSLTQVPSLKNEPIVRIHASCETTHSL